MITDLQCYYLVPIVIPPVPYDIPGQGVPSGHNGVLVVPLFTEKSQRTADSRKVNIRPLPESLISKFGSILIKAEWDFLAPDMSPTEIVHEFENHTSRLVKNTFPEKTVKISYFDEPYFTEELREIRRQRQRVYRKGGRIDKYLKLKVKFDQKLKNPD